MPGGRVHAWGVCAFLGGGVCMPGGECACPGACVPGGDVHALEKGGGMCAQEIGVHVWKGGHAWHACLLP